MKNKIISKILKFIEDKERKLLRKFQIRTEYMQKGSDEYVKELNDWRIKSRKLSDKYAFILKF